MKTGLEFTVGETVLYKSNGVCKITEIKKMDFCGDTLEYYVLSPVYDNHSTVFVPTGSKELTSQMRHILSPDEINTLIRSIPEEEIKWIENDNIRNDYFREIIADGDRVRLACMIKSIYLHGNELREAGKKLHVADERMLEKAEKILYEEFSHVMKIKREDVPAFIASGINAEIKSGC